jgi:hypothetical protein
MGGIHAELPVASSSTSYGVGCRRLHVDRFGAGRHRRRTREIRMPLPRYQLSELQRDSSAFLAARTDDSRISGCS